MLRKNTVYRLLAGAICIFIAFSCAFYDFSARRSSSPSKPPSPLPVPALTEPICPAKEEDKGPYDLTLRIEKGDTLMSVLIDAQINKKQAHAIIDLLKKHFDPTNLKPHHEIYLTYIEDEKEPGQRFIESLYFRPTIDKEFWISTDNNGHFSLEKNDIKLNKITRQAHGIIQDSLYLDAGKEGVPTKILHQMIQAFSYDVDFQRSFQPGDEFGLLYEMKADEDGMREEPGQLLYATLSLKGKKLHLYNFKAKEGEARFYNQYGESVKKGLLRTPVDGARISSRFCKNRRHPILGYTRAHKGIDFAAPLGTPIMASGDGVLAQVGPYASYGNYIRIKHNREFSTAYAHLSRFAKGIRAGKPVKQGQIIGYVGSTGSSTGPHLHYEVIRHNIQIDPASVKMLPAAKLGGKELQAFKTEKARIDQQYHHLYLAKTTPSESVTEFEEDTEEDELEAFFDPSGE
jgi:murein DD-endopeptidase MepM/ murein hydrolase activator NlpD